MSQKKESNTTNRELSISRLINAPRELVWEAWTNPEHISQWWGPSGFTNSISKMDIQPGGEWEFIMHGPDGTDYKNKHIYVELDKPGKIIMDHVTHPKFRMTALFEAQGNKTLVTLHSVFESAEQLAEVIKVFKADEGMTQNIQRMDEYITGLNEPFVIERLLNAPTEKVWTAISDRDAMKQWYFDLKEFKPTTGFEFQFTGQGTTGEDYIHLCKVTDVVPGQKLAYIWTYQGRKGYSIVTFELFPEGDKTRVRLTHEGLGSFRGNGPDFAKESFQKGWTEIIGTLLKNFVEKK
jgi:uncharacterized protein YndB with AHSA1/START domain